MILPLKRLNSKSKVVNFFAAGIIGCILEYLVSMFGEYCLHVKWWDYSNYFLNINGRTCLYFGIFWGVLGLWLIYKLNPRIDELIDITKKRIPKKRQGVIVILLNVLLLADMIVSIMALDFYQTRVIVENNINVETKLKEHYEEQYRRIYGNPRLKSFILSAWGNEVMVKSLPNIKVINASGDSVFLSTYYPDIQNYYFMIYDREDDGAINIEKILGGNSK